MSNLLEFVDALNKFQSLVSTGKYSKEQLHEARIKVLDIYERDATSSKKRAEETA